MKTVPKYSPEFRERAVRTVFEHQGEHKTQWAAIVSIASKIGCTAETLRKWVRQAERDQGQREGLSSSERDRLKQLRVRERFGSEFSTCLIFYDSSMCRVHPIQNPRIGR